jgi:MFS family permease
MDVMSAPQSPTAPPQTTVPFYIVLLCVWVIVGFSMGRAQSMGLYLLPVTQELQIGRETFGLMMAVSMLMMGLAAPFTGALIDKYGAGRIVIACLLLGCAGLYVMSIAHSGPTLIFAGFLMGVGVSGTGLTSLKTSRSHRIARHGVGRRWLCVAAAHASADRMGRLACEPPVARRSDRGDDPARHPDLR